MRRALTLMALVLAGEAIFSLPFILPRIFRPTILDVFAIDNTQLGSAMSVYGVVAMVSYVLGGPLADRFSTRRMMSLALVSTALGGVYLWTIPSFSGLVAVYALWGVSTILLFWAGLMRATREWGGASTQGRAFGLLDGGRGLVSALLATLGTALFALSSGENAGEGTAAALRVVIAGFVCLTLAAALAVWWLLPESERRESESRFQIAKLRSIAALPGIWLQALIIVCAYVAYKGTDDLSLLTRDALGASDVEAAWVGTFAFWIRPVSAVCAGLLADRIGGAKTVGLCFALLLAADLGVAGGVLVPVHALLVASIVGTCVAVYALRGVYFALLPEAGVPLALTGSAVGIVSLVGYTPDVFFGPLMGWILDRKPGAEGHQDLFLVLSVFALVGLLATMLFAGVSAKRKPVLPG
ncbi:MAG: nitrate/nitrite transporter [Polyangiales bacterium]